MVPAWLKNVENSQHLETSANNIVDEKYRIGDRFSIAKFATEELELEIFEAEFENPKRFGAIVKENDKWSVFVNKDLDPQLRRVTVAHEIGHYLYSFAPGSKTKEYFEKNTLIKDDGSVEAAYLYKDGFSGLCSGRVDAENKIDDVAGVENEANKIASSLLMPEDSIRSYVNQGLEISEMADLFDVPVPVVIGRLHHLKLLSKYSNIR